MTASVQSAYSPLSSLRTLRAGDRLLSLEKPLVMGVLNVTPDSFYAASRAKAENDLLKKAEQMLTEGADLLDVGGYSSRPGADDVPEAEERERVGQAIQQIAKRFPEIAISVDTFRSEVAKAAVEQGATVVNDISGGQLDERMFETVAQMGAAYVIMHMRGTPQNMKSLAQYDDLLHEILSFFHPRIAKLRALGVKDIVLDPGFGFAKTIGHNFELLKKLPRLQVAGLPLLIGLSRKSMVYKTLDVAPEEALNGTTALHTLALLNGANILRVHDVKEAHQTITLMNAYQNG